MIRVLIADDHGIVRSGLTMLIERQADMQVASEAADGLEAVERALADRPDVAVLDVKMPELDGISAAQRIAEQRIAPVVILTAFSQRDLVERARDIGAMAYLVKPFQKHDLPPAIEMATARFAEIVALELEVRGMSERLEARKLIDRAKGVLMTQHSMSEPEAFRWIQRDAMDRRLSMRDVATRVLGDADEVSAPRSR